MTNVNLQDIFKSWVESQTNKNTKSSYSRVIPDFFEKIFRKSIVEITEDDFNALTPALVNEKYITPWLNQGCKHSTINHYLSIITSFVGYVSINKIYQSVDFNYLTKTSLNSLKLRNDAEFRKQMTITDYQDFIEYLSNLQFSKRYQGKNIQYALVAETMWMTGTRLSAIFENLKWSDIVWETDIMGNEGWTLHVVDKGEVRASNPISEDLYERLYKNLHDDNDSDDALVFGRLNKRSFSAYMKQFGKEKGVEVTCHSIRVGAASELYKMTGDILLVSKFLNHKDVKVTQRYIRINDIRTNAGSYILSADLDIEKISELSESVIKDILTKRRDLAKSLILEAEKMGHLTQKRR